jgi:flavorubredoxin
MMHVFILPKGRYRPQHGHVANNDALCDWDGIGQQQLHFVHDHFLHYLDQCWIYELLLLSYIDWCMNFYYCHVVIYLCDV